MTAPFETHLLGTQRGGPPPTQVGLDFPRRELGKGDALYRSGDAADTVYRIDEGLIKLGIDVLTGKERIVGVAGPGDFIGALTPGFERFQESAEALSPKVVVRVVPIDQARALLGDDLLHAAGVQLWRLREALEDGELPVTARLARTLVRLGRRFGHTSEGGRLHLTLPLTHENLAAMVGAARETTTATLGDMRHRGVLDGTRGRYNFDPEQLADFAAEAAFG